MLKTRQDEIRMATITIVMFLLVLFMGVAIGNGVC